MRDDRHIGVFAKFQPLYAEHRMPTIPVSITDKKPLVRHFTKMGLSASSGLQRRFGTADAIGFVSGRRSRVTVLDIDATDERLLHTAIERHGRSKIVVRTASGKFHAYYRYSGERRRIRPWPDKPIDILGDTGLVVAPPSQLKGGRYEIIHGTLDDLDRLTPMRGLDDLVEPEKAKPKAKPTPLVEVEMIRQGRRNNWLWDQAMRRADAMKRGRCGDFNALLDYIRARNLENCTPPLEEAEVMQITQSAWSHTEEGRNYYGRRRTWFDEPDVFMLHDRSTQDAFLLLMYLRAHNGPLACFMCANGLAETLQWDRRRFAAARSRLIELGYMEQVQKPFSGSPARYRWTP
jgi:hypothetical protein